MDAYLSPEMKSTGEAIGYDDKLHRAMYKALQASGMKLQNYGTVVVTLADEDKEEALPLVRRFYNLGFNIEATEGTAALPEENTASAPASRSKISEGSSEILDSIRARAMSSYVINTRDLGSQAPTPRTARHIRRVRRREQCHHVHRPGHRAQSLLDVLEETTLRISTIDA